MNVSIMNHLLHLFSPDKKIEVCKIIGFGEQIFLKNDNNYYCLSAGSDFLKLLLHTVIKSEIEISAKCPCLEQKHTSLEKSEPVIHLAPLSTLKPIVINSAESTIIKPILMEIKLAFNDLNYTVNVDDLAKIYTLDTFCKMQICYVAKSRIEVILYIDRRADYVLEQKAQEILLEKLMHTDTTTLSQFTQALKDSKKMLKNHKFQSWVVGDKNYNPLSILLQPSLKTYHKRVSLYQLSAHLSIDATIIFRDETLLPSK